MAGAGVGAGPGREAYLVIAGIMVKLSVLVCVHYASRVAGLFCVVFTYRWRREEGFGQVWVMGNRTFKSKSKKKLMITDY